MRPIGTRGGIAISIRALVVMQHGEVRRLDGRVMRQMNMWRGIRSHHDIAEGVTSQDQWGEDGSWAEVGPRVS